jgi:hypothetical protein
LFSWFSDRAVWYQRPERQEPSIPTVSGSERRRTALATNNYARSKFPVNIAELRPVESRQAEAHAPS